MDFQTTVSNQELHGIDREPTEFEWNILPALTSLEMVRKVQDDLHSRNIDPENFGSNCLHVHFQRP